MPSLGRIAIIKKNNVEIGYCKNVSLSIGAELVKEYTLDSDRPFVLENGNKTFTVSIEKAYIDGTYITDVLNGSKVTIEVRPEGISGPIIILSDVVFHHWEMSAAQDGIIMESVEGEGADMYWSIEGDFLSEDFQEDDYLV